MRVHAFRSDLFRRQRLPWLLMMMTPGFVVQGMVLMRFLHRDPGSPSSPGELMMLLLTALALFQGGPLVWYLGLGWLRKRSQVLVGKHRLIWRRRRLGLGSEELSYADRLDVRVEQLLSVTRSTTGALRIQGDIRRLYSDTGTGSLDRIRKTSRFTLPAYYEDMEGIAQALAQLLPAPGSSACRNQKKHGNT